MVFDRLCEKRYLKKGGVETTGCSRLAGKRDTGLNVVAFRSSAILCDLDEERESEQGGCERAHQHTHGARVRHDGAAGVVALAHALSLSVRPSSRGQVQRQSA